MLEFLKSPYPLYRLNRRRIIIIIGIGLFVALFLLFFQPFQTDRLDIPNKNAFLLGYGIVISASVLLFEWVITKLLFKNIKEESWLVAWQILWVMSYICFALVASYFYKQWYLEASTSWTNFIGFFQLAMSIAIFPIVIVTLLDYTFQLKNNQKEANQINLIKTKPGPISLENKIEVFSENKKESILLLTSELLYIQSMDNYVELVYFTGGSLDRKILRNTLIGIEGQINDNKIIRCHRSYIVNLHKVNNVSGNAQGYRLHLSDLESTIPVARSKSKTILKLLKE